MATNLYFILIKPSYEIMHENKRDWNKINKAEMGMTQHFLSSFNTSPWKQHIKQLTEMTEFCCDVFEFDFILYPDCIMTHPNDLIIFKLRYD